MTAGDDDGMGDEDPMVRGMRSVWLEMRDQDPPTRGLAELMAAARDQAAVMKPADEESSWWRRAFAMMVRPPMLAAATVLVLIGGAVVIKGRSADEVATPTTSTFEREEKNAESGAKKPDPAADTPVVATPAPAPEPAPVEGAHGFGSATVHQTPPPPAPMVPRAKKPDPIVTTKPPVKDTVKETQKQEEPGADKVEKPKAEKATDSKKVQDRPQGGLEIANDGDTGGAPTEQPTNTSRAPRPAPPKTGESAPARREVSTENLVKQAEVAASRNDCAAVRVTVERIKKLDATTHKRVANQPAIARCLK